MADEGVRIDPNLHIRYHVTAYDESGYGDNASRDFGTKDEAVTYARSLLQRYGVKKYGRPAIWRRITMEPINTEVAYEDTHTPSPPPGGADSGVA